MESLSPKPSFRDRCAPWMEGGLLAVLVMVVVSLGGDAVRTSYHGYLHSGIGEAVLRDGLMPENPYHAGTALHYYTLYPTLGVLLGRLGGGPLWGFAILNIFAAMLMGPALDAYAKRLGLNFTARRFAFLSMVLGFNGLAAWWVASDVPMVEGASPLIVLLDLTKPMASISWDGRLQAFLPKFLNVSSFALSLPFALFALADSFGTGKRELLRMGVLLGVTMALNPLVGGFVAILVVVAKLPLLFSGLDGLRQLMPAAILALVISVPFLLPLLVGAPEGEASMAGTFPFIGSGAWANLLGPLHWLLPLGLLGIFQLAKERRTPLLLALGLATVFSFLSLPWNNEYKFPRMAGIVLALPCGALLAYWWKILPGKIFSPLLLLLCLPTFWLTYQAYSQWDLGTSNLLDHVEDGRLAVRAEALLQTWPAQLAAAEKDLPDDTVLVFHPWHPGIRGSSLGSSLGSQGNPLVPVLSHPLFVDAPQIHNVTLPDLRARLDESFALWQGRHWVKQQKNESEPFAPATGLRKMRQRLPHRHFAIVTLKDHPAVKLLSAAGASLIVEENELALWLLPPLGARAGS